MALARQWRRACRRSKWMSLSSCASLILIWRPSLLTFASPFRFITHNTTIFPSYENELPVLHSSFSIFSSLCIIFISFDLNNAFLDLILLIDDRGGREREALEKMRYCCRLHAPRALRWCSQQNCWSKWQFKTPWILFTSWWVSESHHPFLYIYVFFSFYFLSFYVSNIVY